MDRRKFCKAETLAGVGAALLNPLQGFTHTIKNEINYKNKKAKSPSGPRLDGDFVLFNRN